jgi:hypothetical protein
MDPIVLLNGRYFQYVDHVLFFEVHNGLSLFYGLNFDQIIPTLAALNRKNRNRLSNQNSRFFGLIFLKYLYQCFHLSFYHVALGLILASLIYSTTIPVPFALLSSAVLHLLILRSILLLFKPFPISAPICFDLCFVSPMSFLKRALALPI